MAEAPAVAQAEASARATALASAPDLVEVPGRTLSRRIGGRATETPSRGQGQLHRRGSPAGYQGEVTLEIVVRRDGSVGDVRVLRGLGNGLDRMAIDAVRQWQFAPAHRLGSPVDVIVEVGVQFKLR